jgi:hypothetical protein
VLLLLQVLPLPEPLQLLAQPRLVLLLQVPLQLELLLPLAQLLLALLPLLLLVLYCSVKTTLTMLHRLRLPKATI